MNQKKSLPEGWDWTKLEKIIEPSKERANPTKIAKMRYIGLEHIETESGKLLGFGHSDEVRSTKTVFRMGDLLYGKLRPYLNKVHVVDFDGICSTDILVFSKQEGVSNKFLQYRLLSMDFVRFANRNAKGVQHPRVSPKTVANFNLALPPLLEQHRIVAKIEELFTQLDAGVAELEQAKVRLKQYRQSVLKAAVEGELTREWREGRLAQVRVKHLPDEATSKPGADGQMLHPNEDASQLLQRILAERRSKWETAQWAKEIERAQKKAAQAKRRAEGKPARIRDLQPEEWGAIIEADYARYLPKNDKWKAKYKEPAAPDTEGLPGLPEGWVWGNLQQLSWNASYGTSQKCTYEAEGPPVVRIPNIVNGSIVFEDVKYATRPQELGDEKAIARNDLLIIRTNGSRDLIGRAAIVRKEFDAPVYFASYLIRYRIISEGSMSQWLISIWDSSFVRLWMEQKAATTAGQYNVSVSKLDKLPIPIPPSNE